MSYSKMSKNEQDFKKTCKLRNVVFTAWEIEPIFNIKMEYLIYKMEECPETKRIHYQGYCEFKNQIRFNEIKNILGNKTYICNRKGTQKQAIDYVCKELTKLAEPKIFGVPKSQGERVLLTSTTRRLLNGESLKSVCMDEPEIFCKFHKGFEKLENYVNEIKSTKKREVKVYILIGDTGTGKTHFIYNKNDIKDIYSLRCEQNEALFFDNYQGQKILLIDDFYGTIPRGFLLKILEGFSQILNVKGSYTYALWDTVYITSNKNYEEWYTKFNDITILNAFKSRINEVIYFEGQDNRRIKKGQLITSRYNNITNIFTPYINIASPSPSSSIVSIEEEKEDEMIKEFNLITRRGSG